VAGSSRPVKLVVSGDTAGWLTPCGCTSNQSGGLLRRGTYLAQLGQSADVVYADAGGAAAGESDYQKVKFEAILAGERKMGLAAHNVGRSEAAFGADYLRDVARRMGAPLVSANLRDADGRPVAEAVRIVTAGGRRIAITGVCSPGLAAGGLKADDPRQAVLAAAGGAKGRYDALVVLAYLPPEELEALAASLPEADAVVGGPTGQAVAPRPVGPTLLAAATNKGKFLVELDAPAPPAAGGSSQARWDGKIVEMSASLADQEAQRQGVQTYLAELGRRDFTAKQTGLVAPLPPGTPADYRVAGSASCVKCHAEDHAAWEQSKHAHAWQTLSAPAANGFHVDPFCQQCHTTGYGLPGGFESRAATPGLVSVGCDNCHGPSAAHAARPQVHTPFAAADQCTRCHDHENSPKFEYNEYWGRIRHGKKVAPNGEREGTGQP
jgi:hypothetical protein